MGWYSLKKHNGTVNDDTNEIQVNSTMRSLWNAHNDSLREIIKDAIQVKKENNLSIENRGWYIYGRNHGYPNEDAYPNMLNTAIIFNPRTGKRSLHIHPYSEKAKKLIGKFKNSLS